MVPASDDTPYADLLAVSRRHREDHGCGAYPYDKGTMLRRVRGSTPSISIRLTQNWRPPILTNTAWATG